MEIDGDKLSVKISDAKDGSQSAFNYLLDRFWNDVYGFQLKKTHNEYEAEDITIQTFSKAFNKIDTFDNNYSFATWLIAISKNIHIDQIRKKKSSITSRTSMQDEERVYEIADETPGIEDKLIK